MYIGLRNIVKVIPTYTLLKIDLNGIKLQRHHLGRAKKLTNLFTPTAPWSQSSLHLKCGGRRTDLSDGATYWVPKKDRGAAIFWLTVEILKFDMILYLSLFSCLPTGNRTSYQFTWSYDQRLQQTHSSDWHSWSIHFATLLSDSSHIPH